MVQISHSSSASFFTGLSGPIVMGCGLVDVRFSDRSLPQQVLRNLPEHMGSGATRPAINSVLFCGDLRMLCAGLVLNTTHNGILPLLFPYYSVVRLYYSKLAEVCQDLLENFFEKGRWKMSWHSFWKYFTLYSRKPTPTRARPAFFLQRMARRRLCLL